MQCSDSSLFYLLGAEVTFSTPPCLRISWIWTSTSTEMMNYEIWTQLSFFSFSGQLSTTLSIRGHRSQEVLYYKKKMNTANKKGFQAPFRRVESGLGGGNLAREGHPKKRGVWTSWVGQRNWYRWRPRTWDEVLMKCSAWFWSAGLATVVWYLEVK